MIVAKWPLISIKVFLSTQHSGHKAMLDNRRLDYRDCIVVRNFKHATAITYLVTTHGHDYLYILSDALWSLQLEKLLLIKNLLLLLLLLLLLIAMEFSLSGSRPYTSTDKTDKNKYTLKK
jgi:hypothetical protein